MNYLSSKCKKLKGLIFILLLNLKRIFRKITSKSFYYVIGDSHTLNFLHEAFIIKHIGPATAYKLGFEKSTTNSKEKVINILNKIYKNKPINVIFVFGELDARIHIYKVSKEKNIDVDTLINRTVESYINFVNLVKGKFPLIIIYIFNVLPQGEERNIYKFSYYASINERRKIAEKMNNLLKKYTKLNNIKFIDIYNKLIDQNGRRRKDYIFDDVHFNRKIMSYILDYITKLNEN